MECNVSCSYFIDNYINQSLQKNDKFDMLLTVVQLSKSLVSSSISQSLESRSSLLQTTSLSFSFYLHLPLVCTRAFIKFETLGICLHICQMICTKFACGHTCCKSNDQFCFRFAYGHLLSLQAHRFATNLNTVCTRAN